MPTTKTVTALRHSLGSISENGEGERKSLNSNNIHHLNSNFSTGVHPD